jgi:hypothetical protein
MATTTPNYGWTVPTSTDLVKDGATAIETLGDAIDASMNTALGTKKAGMVLLNTTSFSGVASTSLAASTFNSTYRNYRIILNFRPATNNTTFTWRIRKAGSDVTTSTYFLAGTSTQSGSATISSYRVNGGTSFSTNADIPNSADTIVSFDITDTTNSNQLKGFGSIMSTAGIYYSFGFVNSTADTADSMTFYMSSGNITGRYQVFGYNE